jgi:ribosome-associated heat shock protein Hsp15
MPRDRPEAHGEPPEPGTAAGMRLDKWLWAARFVKTRALAVEQIDKGRVMVNGAAAKPGREIRPGDRLELRLGPLTRVVDVLGLSPLRGPAPQAQRLYAETTESLAERERQAQQRRMGTEPALAIEQGRPTKRDRRQLADWNRWSASVDDLPDRD